MLEMVQFGRKAPWILEVFPESGPVAVMTLGVSKQQTITHLRDLEDKRNLNRFKILKDNPKPWLFLVIYGDCINMFDKDSTLEPVELLHRKVQP